MATVKEELVIGGNFAQVFSSYLNLGRQMAANMQVVTGTQNGFTEAVAQSERALAEMAGAGDIAARSMGETSDAAREMSGAATWAAEQQEKMNQTFQEGAKSADALTGKLKGLLTTYLSFQGVKMALNWVDGNLNLANIQRNAENQLNAVLANMGVQNVPVMVDFQVDVSQTMSAFDAIAQKASEIQGRGIYGDEAMIASAAEFATYFKDANAIMSMMDTLADYTMGMTGGGAVDKSSMVDYATNLGKIMSGSYDAMTKKGFEFTDAQKAIIEGTATQAQIVAALGTEYLDMSVDMQAAAAINSVIAESWGGLYEAMSNTPEGKIIQLQNRMGDLKEMLGNGLYPSVIRLVDTINSHYQQIERMFTYFAYGCSLVVDGISWVIDAAAWGFEWVEENWDIVSSLLIGGASAIGVSMAMSAAQSVAAAAKTIAAWAAVNWPLVLVGVAVAGVIYLAKKMGATWEDVAGVVGGAFGLMYAFAMNNFIVPGQNAFAIFGNFVGNFLNDPAAAVKILFLDLATFALDKLSAVAHGMERLINKIPGMSVNLTSGIDSLYASVSAAAQSAKDASEWTEYFKPWDYLDYSDTAQAWSEKWASAGRMFDNFSFDKFLEGMNSSYGNQLTSMPEINNALSDIAADTKAIRNSVALSEEDIKLLVDMATHEYVNNINLTSQTPVITVNNQSSGDSELDGQKIADAIKEILLEESASNTSLSYT